MICPHCGHDNLPGVEACGHCEQALAPLDQPRPDSRVERCLVEDAVSTLRAAPPVTLPPEATLGAALIAMQEHNVGAILVVAADGSLLGIFSERDLLKKVAGVHADFADLPVSQFMTPRPETVATTDTLNYVLHKMDGGGYRHVPVLRDGRPIGIISVRDMLRHLTRLCKEAQ